MESSRGRRVEKRAYEESLEDEDGGLTHLKKPRLPGLASVIVEALKVDSMQRLCSSLEPLLRKIVSEEVERALMKLGHAKLAGRSSPPRIQGPEGKNLQLHFKTRMPPHLFTGGKVEGEQGAAIHVVLLDASTGNVVQTEPESAAKLNIVVLEGDFNEEADDDWTKEDFEGHEVKERQGKRPLLTGELQLCLKGGVGTLGDMTFTDNSSWIRSRKFRLGLKVAPGYCKGVRVREAKTEAFVVKDHRGELYKKHYPPALHDEVWRLDRIAKDGALHKKLIKAEIVTVEDFLRLLVKDPQKLRSILGSGMSNRMWDNTVEHAKTCVLGEKLYVYYEDGTNCMGAVFTDIYELRGLIADGQFFALDSLTHNQKVSVDSLVKGAYENWNQVVEYDGKILNSLSIGKNGTIASAASISDHSQSTTTQNKQQYSQSEPSPQSQPKNNHPSNSQLIEFPFMRSDSMAGMAATTPENAFGAVDYGSVGMSAYGGSYLPGEWPRPRDEQGFEDFSEEIRLRSSEMLESDDLQRLLKSMGVGVGIGSALGDIDEDCYSYNVPYDHQVDRTYMQERGRSSGRAVVGWLKLKAALRWGIFIRKRAAERRAQLVEL
ncbi:LOW QUALITY PROTEIN: calmodulin-binding protein 60 E-like [Actinidia eriantha]|uniref:LOW QUALITY PROTEIN: calmodulin-binding protein 60 E-like n=1 Tax=Actinidia eriantha TaxID=165200 RepID=UPI002588F031|nr:LOW QUALITY PROTEIN: calmodulin-binding protein 60 E-like [Actinidia eriantha]